MRNAKTFNFTVSCTVLKPELFSFDEELLVMTV